MAGREVNGPGLARLASCLSEVSCQPGWPNLANQVGRARPAGLSGWGLARLAWLTGPTDPGRLGNRKGDVGVFRRSHQIVFLM